MKYLTEFKGGIEMNQQQVQPIYILPQDTKQQSGRSAQRSNILAAKLVAETVRTTLGPKGMDKMIVDSLGDIVVTNDGVTILEELQVEHPAAKMVVEIAKTQEAEIGDGTTTAVVLAGELLKKAESLIDSNIHPTVIVKGYRLAAEQALIFLNRIAIKISPENETEILKKIAMTAMTGKGAESHKEMLADITVEAVHRIKEDNGDISLDNIKIEQKSGVGIEETELIQGILIDRDKVHSQMKRKVTKADIALLDCELQIRNTETESKIQINDPNQLQEFLDMEETMIKRMTDKVIESKANVVFCSRNIDDIAQHFLQKAGILAIRNTPRGDMLKLEKAIKGKMVKDIKDLTYEDLGYAENVEIKKVNERYMTFVEGCKSPKSVTILARASTDHVADEVKRAIEDAIGVIREGLKTGKVIAGAGYPEIILTKHLLKFSESLSGREQLAVKAFAESMEVIPRTLAENAGLDPIDSITDLKSSLEKVQGMYMPGINVYTGKTMDAWAEGVIEPLKVKTQAISSATEVATMILRIDDVIASGRTSDRQDPHDMERAGQI